MYSINYYEYLENKIRNYNDGLDVVYSRNAEELLANIDYYIMKYEDYLIRNHYFKNYRLVNIPTEEDKMNYGECRKTLRDEFKSFIRENKINSIICQ